ncbi:MAG TPA: hypothetical protein VEJ67_02510 [Candidatus Cybelea sp.]|nr:hypothetical protein [Candidatus Cybelea sp.]
MKVRPIILVLALCFVGAAASYGSDDAFMGTWKLNEAKSKLAAGSGKNSTVMYEVSGDSVKVTIDGTGTDGAATHSEWTGKFDGKDYPVTGNSAEDTRAVKMVTDHTLTFAVKKDGKIIETGRIVVSVNGKTRTVTTHQTDAKGMRTTSTAVYDKQ